MGVIWVIWGHEGPYGRQTGVMWASRVYMGHMGGLAGGHADGHMASTWRGAPELARVEAGRADLDGGEEDLRRGGAECHEGEVGDGGVPDGDGEEPLAAFDAQLLGVDLPWE
eukprot:1891754-Prymnesium_polylepis.1